MTETRRHPDRPIVAVGAVIVHDGRVLLVKRGQEPLKGQWSLPGGAVETGETLHAALAREVLEETCLTVEIGPVVEVLDSIRLDERGRAEYHYIIIDYVCHVRAGAPTAAACGSDADGACWVGAADLDRYHVTAAATAVIRKALSGLQGF